MVGAALGSAWCWFSVPGGAYRWFRVHDGAGIRGASAAPPAIAAVFTSHNQALHHCPLWQPGRHLDQVSAAIATQSPPVGRFSILPGQVAPRYSGPLRFDPARCAASEPAAAPFSSAPVALQPAEPQVQQSHVSKMAEEQPAALFICLNVVAGPLSTFAGQMQPARVASQSILDQQMVGRCGRPQRFSSVVAATSFCGMFGAPCRVRQFYIPRPCSGR